MKSSSYSPYIRDHGSRIWSTYGSSIDIFFTIFPMNWRTRRATLANSSASRSHPQPKYMHQNVSICQTSAAICAAVRELNRRGFDLVKTAVKKVISTMQKDNLAINNLNVGIFWFADILSRVYPSSGEAGHDWTAASQAVGGAPEYGVDAGIPPY